MAGVPLTPGAPQLDDDNPWPGLEAYTEAAQRWFHGRDADTAELLRLIRQSPFVALYGKSGLGKSSMLQAGVFPALREARFLPIYLRLDYTEAAAPPQQQALARLLQAAAEAGVEAPAPEPGESLWAYLQRRERPFWTHDNFPLTPVLVFDQFEEIFSRGGAAAHVRQMLDSIADLAGNRLPAELAEDREAARRLNLQSPQYHVVLSFRSDFLAEVEGWEKRANLPQREAHHLEAMQRFTAIQAVQRAGAAVLEPGVAEQIVDFVLGHDDSGGTGVATEVEPVLLSLCCYQLNNRRQRPARIDSALLNSVGQDILLDFYNDALAGMPPRVSEFIEDNLIQGGRYRSSYPRQEAVDSGALTQDELDELMKRRLLRVDPQGRVPRIELIHDRLVGIVRDARDARLTRQQHAAEREEARKQAEEERDHERLAHAQQSRSRLIVAVTLLTIAFGLALFSARDAWIKSERARSAEERATALRLGVEARGMLGGTVPGDDARAFQYLLVARQLWQSDQTEQPLLAALTERQHLRSFTPLVVPLDSDAVAVAFTPADAPGAPPTTPLLVAGHLDGSVSVRLASQPQQVLARAAGHGELVQSVAISPDGQRMVSASDDGSMRLWQIRPQLAPLGAAIKVGQEQPVFSAAFSPDGRRIVSAGADGIVRLWPGSGGKPIAQAMPLPGAVVYGVAFSADGKTIGAVTGANESTRTASLFLLDAGKLGTLPVKGNPFFAHAQDGLTLAFSPSGRWVVSGGQDDTLRLREVAGNPQATVRMGGRGGDVQSVSFHPSERWLAAGHADGALRLWQLPGGDALGQPLADHGGPVTSVAFSADGQWLASAAQDSPLRLWPLDATWAPVGGVLDPQFDPRVAALAREGQVALMLDRNGKLLLREGTASRELGALPPAAGVPPLVGCEPPKAGADKAQTMTRGMRLQNRVDEATVAALALGGDGRRAAAGLRDGRLILFDLAGAAPAHSVPASGCALVAVAISRDGQRLAAADSRSNLLITDAEGNRLSTRRGPEADIRALALSADGQRLAIGAGPLIQLIALGEAKRGAETVTLQGVFEDITSLDFSPDGQQLVAGSSAGNVRVWDLRTQRPLGAPQDANRGAVPAVAFGADGQRFHSLGRGGAARPWPSPATWSALMCAKLSRNLSHQHWREWVSTELPYRCPCPGLPIEPDAAASGAAAAPPPTCPAPQKG